MDFLEILTGFNKKSNGGLKLKRIERWIAKIDTFKV
jgi:hypothetical protein